LAVFVAQLEILFSVTMNVCYILSQVADVQVKEHCSCGFNAEQHSLKSSI